MKSIKKSVLSAVCISAALYMTAAAFFGVSAGSAPSGAGIISTGIAASSQISRRRGEAEAKIYGFIPSHPPVYDRTCSAVCQLTFGKIFVILVKTEVFL